MKKVPNKYSKLSIPEDLKTALETHSLVHELEEVHQRDKGQEN